MQYWPSDNYKFVIHADQTPRGEHERRYNAPIVNGVAVLVTGDPSSPRDIVLRAHDNTLKREAHTHRFYDVLQYPLIFSNGESGYHFNIPVINPTTEQPIPNKKVSCMDFYAYYMMLQPSSAYKATFSSILSRYVYKGRERTSSLHFS